MTDHFAHGLNAVGQCDLIAFYMQDNTVEDVLGGQLHLTKPFAFLLFVPVHGKPHIIRN